MRIFCTYFLDVLKPHRPSSTLVAKTLLELEGVRTVRVSVDELDQKTASLHIKVEGTDVEIEEISRTLEELNCALHSVDEVMVKKMDDLPED
ncbi:MAG: hypothetical protein GF317_00815 [Candidatus Lokiarchaeota archaeon]|nr:hypothetical protein [Candidatus Lokiarchaeota archaeon]MBD3198502.1 hypothetical protein [Candidatus Lokiarchaeota archaeon]